MIQKIVAWSMYIMMFYLQISWVLRDLAEVLSLEENQAVQEQSTVSLFERMLFMNEYI